MAQADGQKRPMVLTGLSGSGKTSIIEAATTLAGYYNLALTAIPKYTTRPPRPTGTAMYQHVPPEVFESMRVRREFALVHKHANHLYGIRKEDAQKQGGIVTIPPASIDEALVTEEFRDATIVGIDVDLQTIHRRLNDRVWNAEDEKWSRLESLAGEQVRFDGLRDRVQYLLRNPDPVLEEEEPGDYRKWYKTAVLGRVREVAERVLAILAWESAKHEPGQRAKDYVNWLERAMVRRNTDTSPNPEIPRHTRYVRVKEDRLIRHVRGDPLELSRLNGLSPIEVARVSRDSGGVVLELARIPAPRGASPEHDLTDLLGTVYAPHVRVCRDERGSGYLRAVVDDKPGRQELIVSWEQPSRGA
jgi:guanylate kinase